MIFTRITAILLGLVALTHLYRVIANWEFIVGGIVVPPWISIVATIVAGILSIMVWRESSNTQNSGK